MSVFLLVGLAVLLPGGPARRSPPRPPLEARAKGRGLELVGPSGARFVFAPRVLVDHRSGWGGRGRPRARSYRPSSWVSVKAASARWRFVAEVAGPTFRCRLALSRPRVGRRLLLSVTMTYLKDAYPRLEAVELYVRAKGGRWLHRDLAVRPLRRRGTVHVGRWTPKWIELALAGPRSPGWLSLWGGPRLSGLQVTRRRGGRTRVRWELDDARNHPWVTHRRCLRRYRHRAPTTARHERLRRRGVVARYRIWMVLSRRPGVPVWAHRWPHGRLAALTFTGHADQARLEATRAVLQGAGRRSHRRFGRGGFVGRGLVYTKSFFWRRARFPQPGESAGFRRLADAMFRRGFEVIPHSATTYRDSRATTQKGLKFFRRYQARTWIDHRSETNCEAYSNRGWKKGSPYYIGDLLHRAGYRYLWAGRDASHLPWPGLNLLAPKPHHRRRHFLFRRGVHPKDSPRGFWIWWSQWMYYKRKRALGFWSRRYLDRLERDRGVHVAHVYLDALHPPGHRLHAYNMLYRGTGGVPLLHRGFERVLRELARRKRRGTLWNTTLSGIADRLIALGDVAVTYGKSGRLLVRNGGKATLKGFTMTVASPKVQVRVNGKRPAGARHGRRRTDFWFDLPPAKTVTIGLGRASRPLPLLGP